MWKRIAGSQSKLDFDSSTALLSNDYVYILNGSRQESRNILHAFTDMAPMLRNESLLADSTVFFSDRFSPSVESAHQ